MRIKHPEIRRPGTISDYTRTKWNRKWASEDVRRAMEAFDAFLTDLLNTDGVTIHIPSVFED